MRRQGAYKEGKEIQIQKKCKKKYEARGVVVVVAAAATADMSRELSQPSRGA